MDIWSLVIMVAIFLVEYFLGSTKLVKANSLVEAILEAAKKVLVFLKENRQDEEEKK